MAATKPYIKMTSAERKQYRAEKNAKAAQAAAEQAKAEGGGEPFFPHPEDIPKSDDDSWALGEFAQIALALAKAKGGSVEEQTAADRAWATIDALSEGARKRLMENPNAAKLFSKTLDKDGTAAFNPTDPPGSYQYRVVDGRAIPFTKKPWQWSDLYKPAPPKQPMPLKTWVPAKRMNILWNGLAVSLIPNKEVTLPEVFYGEYMDHFRRVEAAEQHAQYIFGVRDQVPDDSSVITAGSGHARATSLRGRRHGQQHNVFEPGGGFVANEPGNAHSAAELDDPE